MPRSTYTERRAAFLAWAAAAPSGTGRTGFFSQIARLAVGLPPDRTPIDAALALVAAREDCADFSVAGLIRLVMLFDDHPALPRAVRDSIDAALLGFKYWIDQPDDDMMCYWSEHHQIMFHSAEYLAVQRFATRHFDNSGLTGAEHMQRARRRILRWIDLRARIGFAEWNSNTYHDEDMMPLLNLADFAADGEVARRAAALLDVMFACMALDSFRGTSGTAHGRSYPAHMLDGHASPKAAAQNIAWGWACFMILTA